jgi:hypothetical protein
MQKEGVVGMSEDDVLPQKGVFEKGVVSVDLFEDIVIAVDESELVIAFATRFIVEVEGIFSNKYVIVAELADQLTDVLEFMLCYFLLFLNLLDCQSQLGNGGVVKC